MLKKYLGVKVVFASEMTAEAASKKHYVVSSKEEYGYEVTYEDGYKSWCPKTVFENHNIDFEKTPLAESVPMMFSDNKVDRFKAEYIQIKVHIEEIENLIKNLKENELDFLPKFSFGMLNEQLCLMKNYAEILERTAKISDVDVPDICVSQNEDKDVFRLKIEEKNKIDEYQTCALSTELPVPIPSIVYDSLAINGEAGEIAEKVKKIYRDCNGQTTAEKRQEIIIEIGDVLWYAAVLSHHLGYKLSNVMELNLRKINSRKERDKINGDGDER